MIYYDQYCPSNIGSYLAKKLSNTENNQCNVNQAASPWKDFLTAILVTLTWEDLSILRRPERYLPMFLDRFWNHIPKSFANQGDD